jgi:DNA polymerase-3 subunit alpha
MPAVAITDIGNLFGALEFATRCSAAGVLPITGCEIALELARRPDRVVALGNGQLTAMD